MTTLVEDHMAESLKDHAITSIHESQRTYPVAAFEEKLIKAFWMRRPPGYEPKAAVGYYSALIIFSQLGVTIGGDVRIGNLAAVNSVPGYGEAWFGDHLDEQYLCGKFNLDWTTRAPKSRRAEVMKISCGWLCAVQQRFSTLWLEMKASDPQMPKDKP